MALLCYGIRALHDLPELPLLSWLIHPSQPRIPTQSWKDRRTSPALNGWSPLGVLLSLTSLRMATWALLTWDLVNGSLITIPSCVIAVVTPSTEKYAVLYQWQDDIGVENNRTGHGLEFPSNRGMKRLVHLFIETKEQKYSQLHRIQNNISWSTGILTWS